MTEINTATLFNLIGFTTGATLYAMLLVMVLRHTTRFSRAAEKNSSSAHATSGVVANNLLLATAVLGLLWNVGALATYGVKDFGVGEPFPILVMLSFAALGFLPAVVVHSALRSSGDGAIAHRTKATIRNARWIMIGAYSLSAVAGLMHFHSGLVLHSGPSDAALRALTIGYAVLIFALFIATRRQPGWKRAVWGSALAVFAVSALHLSKHHYGGAEAWPVELLGHHASLPLALAILYQDYRFAFADIFLKRALALLMLVALAFGLYIFIAAPLIESGGARSQVEPHVNGVLLGLWVLTALAYPTLRRTAIWFVDAVVLRRADYGEMRAQLARLIGMHEEATTVLDTVCQELSPALSAREVRWSLMDAPDSEFEDSLSVPPPRGEGTNSAPDTRSATYLATTAAKEVSARLSTFARDENIVTLLEHSPEASAVVNIPTAEPPYFNIVIGRLAGGRCLLSDDIVMLEVIAVMAARRIDALRVIHERCEQGLREQEISKLAAEAQLRALRAQVNPHFLFNALTTIGYLIKTSPDRALETLLKLTDLLRRVLRATGEFVTLGEELRLIASYLDIERERFEERLRVRIDVPPELLGLRLPSLLVQPLVENAIKHGIAPARFGGEVTISARLEMDSGEGHAARQSEVLSIRVSDTGLGASENQLARGRRRGFGLNNIEERLRCHCGDAATLVITSVAGVGTTAEIKLPVTATAGRALYFAGGAAEAVVAAREGERR